MSSVAVVRQFWLCLTCLVAALGVTPLLAAEDSDPPGRVARLSLIDGEVSFAPAGTEEWAEAVLNRPITSEDRVSVGADGRAELQVGSATVHLDRQTQFGFIELDDDVMQMSLVDGAATIRLRRRADSEIVKIETPNATVELREVGEYHIEVDPDSDQTIVKTRSGAAEVSGGGSRYTVRANERGVFNGLETLSAQLDTLAPRTPFEAWANDRERRHQEAESARYVSHDIVGYEDLDDHGDWVHERDYGYVWRPRYVVHDWAPYRFGRWAWVSPWGWTWIDDARWGFAPFHYGRWAHISHRWCWVPGPRHLRPIYAPALVGWYGGPSVSVSVSFGNVGWYPLGPHDIYVPGYRHTPRYIRHVNVSNTFIVNNTYITNAYGRRGHYDEHRYRRYNPAVTAVQRDHFVSGRSLGGQRVRLNDDDLRRWRADARPPAIAPYRESVLAAAPRARRNGAAARTQEDRWLSDRTSGRRLDFTAERRAIEENGGRPVSRSQLRDHPKEERGDFISSRTAALDDVKRDQRAARQQLDQNRQTERGGSAQWAPRTSGERRQTQRAEDVWRGDDARRNQRVESLRAEEPTREQARSRQTPPRIESGDQERRARSFVQPPRQVEQMRPREVERSQGSAFRSREAASPAPARSSSAPAEQRSRSHDSGSRQESSSRGGSRSEGSARQHGSSRRPD